MPYVTGMIVDRFTGQGLPATVMTSTAVATASGGRFSLMVSPGTHTLSIVLSGYSPTTFTFSASMGDVDIGTIGLDPLFQALRR